MTPQMVVHIEQEQRACGQCKHGRPSALFGRICAHPESKYTIAGEDDFHTCTHMRGIYAPCGPHARLAVWA